MLLVDFQAGSGSVWSPCPAGPAQQCRALARTATTFKVPVIASTFASRGYSGPLLPPLQEALPSVQAIERTRHERTKQRAQSSSRTAAVMEWDSPTHER